MRWWKWLRTIPEQPKWVRLLVGVHVLGSVYGYYWYSDQLRQAPWYLWPVVPDSPTATLTFLIVLFAVLYRFRSPVLEALAYFGMIKYGLWTPIVLGQAMFRAGQFDFVSTQLALSHLGMAAEALIFLPYLRPRWSAAWIATAWFAFNDYMDYAWGTYPAIPYPDELPFVRTAALILTLLAAAVVIGGSEKARRVRAPGLVNSDGAG